MTAPRLDDRTAGILLHPTSLPGPLEAEAAPGAGGTLGGEARRFADFLAAAGQRWWQMLPVGPTGYGDSPYSALSAFAGSPALVSRERLHDEGLLTVEQARDQSAAGRAAALSAAEATFRRRGLRHREGFAAFCEDNRDWLDDFALYLAIKRAHGDGPWVRWPAELRDRHPAALVEARRRFAEEIERHRFEQFCFDEDWRLLRQHCHRRGVGLIGDIPIFVAHDSADVWQHRDLFHLDPAGQPTVVAGVPPDYFSATGQRWGNPLYDWNRLRATGYRWWIDRFRATLARFDAIRLDHFIGFTRAWHIPAAEPTAVNGQWLDGPGGHFFAALRRALGDLPLIAENLGVVTPSVERLRRRFRLPGIKVLQFAFGTDPQGPTFLPHNYPRRAVAYTGTHDNDTAVGWFNDPGDSAASRSPAQVEKERHVALRYLGAGDGREINWLMIRSLYMSVAKVVIVPMQDVLGLGSEARMNRPGLATGNWGWRMDAAAVTPTLTRRLRGLAEISDRFPTAAPGAAAASEE